MAAALRLLNLTAGPALTSATPLAALQLPRQAHRYRWADAVTSQQAATPTPAAWPASRCCCTAAHWRVNSSLAGYRLTAIWRMLRLPAALATGTLTIAAGTVAPGQIWPPTQCDSSKIVDGTIVLTLTSRAALPTLPVFGTLANTQRFRRG